MGYFAHLRSILRFKHQTITLQLVQNFLLTLQITYLIYGYKEHERVTWDFVPPIKPMSTEAKPRMTLVFEG